MMIPKPSHGLHYHTMVFRYSHALQWEAQKNMGGLRFNMQRRVYSAAALRMLSHYTA